MGAVINKTQLAQHAEAFPVDMRGDGEASPLMNGVNNIVNG